MSIDIRTDSLKGKKVLCAVSGGADSMCLLHALWTAGTELAAAHFEHGIRGEEALRDARFVEAWCGERGIECVIGHGNVPEYAKKHRLGTEEAARELRYAFLNETAERLGCALIATAHNADDNAETLLLNLVRGSGSRGLRGIPEERGSIIRPLLGISRAEIEQYLDENGIEHVEDSTNSSDEYSRNLIRHRIIPVLKRMNPALEKTMLRTARLMAQDDDCLQALAQEFLRENYDGESLPLAALRALHPAVAARAVRAVCRESLSMEHVGMILKAAGSTELEYFDVPGQRLRFEKGRLWTGEEEKISIAERALNDGGEIEVPEAGLKIRTETGVWNGEINDLFKTCYLKYENICGELLLTGRKDGDKMRPQGRGCGKKLKSLFAEKAYTQRDRDATPVIRDAQGVIAVYGIAADERVRPEKGDKILKIMFEKI